MFGGRLKSWVESHLPRPLRRKQKSKHKRDFDDTDYDDRPDRHRLTSRSNVELIFRLHQNNPIYSAGNRDGIYGKKLNENKPSVPPTGGFLSSPESAYSTGYSTEGLSPASVSSGLISRTCHKIPAGQKCNIDAAPRSKVPVGHLSPSITPKPGLCRRPPGGPICPSSCSPRPRTAIRTNPWVPSPNRNSYESNTTDSSGIGVSSVPSSLKSRASAREAHYPIRTSAVQRSVSTKCEGNTRLQKYSADSLADSPCSTISVDRETDILSDYESQETKDSTEDEALQRNYKQKVYSYVKQTDNEDDANANDEAEKRYKELILETQSILSFLQDERTRTPLRKPRTEPPSRRFLSQKMSISSSSEDEKFPNNPIADRSNMGESDNKNQCRFKYSPPASFWSITESGRLPPVRMVRHNSGMRTKNEVTNLNCMLGIRRGGDSCPNTPQVNRNVTNCGKFVAALAQKTITSSCPGSPLIEMNANRAVRRDGQQCRIVNGNTDQYDVLASTRKRLEDELLLLRRQQLLTTLEELKQSLEEQSARIQEAFKTSQELEDSFAK